MNVSNFYHAALALSKMENCSGEFLDRWLTRCFSLTQITAPTHGAMRARILDRDMCSRGLKMIVHCWLMR